MKNITVLVLLAFLSGCASLAGVADLQQTGDFRVIDNVPFFPQEEYQCGPASLASLLKYWGVAVTPEEIASAIYSPSARGTLNTDMVFYPESRGLEASRYQGSWDDLRKKIDAGFPLVVLVDYGFSVFQQNHFMVVVGYGEDSVLVNSGKREKKSIPREDFLKSWERTNFWTLLIKRKT